MASVILMLQIKQEMVEGVNSKTLLWLVVKL